MKTGDITFVSCLVVSLNDFSITRLLAFKTELLTLFKLKAKSSLLSENPVHKNIKNGTTKNLDFFIISPQIKVIFIIFIKLR